MVFSNATLEEIATRRPQSTRELLKVSGVGKEKLQKYDEELLELVGGASGASDARGSKKIFEKYP